jgi:hypothetical protein
MEYYEYSGFGADALVVQGELEFNQCDRWAPKAGAWYRYPYPYHSYAQWQLWHGETEDTEETERQVEPSAGCVCCSSRGRGCGFRRVVNGSRRPVACPLFVLPCPVKKHR